MYALGYCKQLLKIIEGNTLLFNQDLAVMGIEELRQIRGEKVAYLAQSAIATFNPALKINEQVTESAVIHGSKTQSEANHFAQDLYAALDLPNPESIGTRYPHQVSGGQLQRLMAAMALCGEPSLLVLDEPTSSMDSETEEKIVNNIFSLPNNPTIIISTHRIQHLTRTDKIGIVGSSGSGKTTLINIIVGLMTDGRFSGGSVGLVIGHVGPEAAVGGPIGLLKDGDIIEIDTEKGFLNVNLK